MIEPNLMKMKHVLWLNDSSYDDIQTQLLRPIGCLYQLDTPSFSFFSDWIVKTSTVITSQENAGVVIVQVHH